jgi:hypothetical protein
MDYPHDADAIVENAVENQVVANWKVPEAGRVH